jgi:hypothetical protein
MMLDPIDELRASLQVLSRSEIERAWSTAEAVNRVLGSNIAQRAELTAYVLASILNDIGSGSERQHDLADALPAVDALAHYVIGRMAVIVTEIGKADAA